MADSDAGSPFIRVHSPRGVSALLALSSPPTTLALPPLSLVQPKTSPAASGVSIAGVHFVHLALRANRLSIQFMELAKSPLGRLHVVSVPPGVV